MQTILKASYPARVWRGRSCFATVHIAASVHGTPTGTSGAFNTTVITTATPPTEVVTVASAVLAATPPPLRALRKMHKISDSRRRGESVTGLLVVTPSSPVVSTPSSLPMRLVSVPPARAINTLALQAAPASTQLAMAPVRLLTQLVQWRRLRSYCASVLPSAAKMSHRYDDCSYLWTLGFRRCVSSSRRCRRTRWAVAVRLLGSTAHIQCMTHPPALTAPTTCSCISTPSIFSGAAAASADPSSTIATAATPSASPLHTSKRRYSSAGHVEGPAAPPRGTSGCSEARIEGPGSSAADGSSREQKSAAEEREAAGENDLEAVAVPSFGEIYVAFQTLQLVQADGHVVREWTVAHVKQAYRALAKQLHPDLAGGDEERMEQVNTAYDLLMGLPAELADNYRMWLESGGEAELQRQRAEDQQGLLHARWVSRDIEQFILVGWCTTLSGCALYALWRTFCGASRASSSVGGTVTAGGRVAPDPCEVRRGIRRNGVHSTGSRLTLPWAGATVSRVAGVHYGVVSSGGSALWMPPLLSLRIMQLMKAAVSRYALAVALTLAACVNTVMLQRIFQRVLTGGGGAG